MKPLYLTKPVREGLGVWLKPGGETLTRRAIDCVSPKPGSLILDAGCGPGGGLLLMSEFGLQPVGLDLEFGLLQEAQKTNLPLVQGDLSRLPFASASVDIIFCECVWSLTEKQQVLTEFHRVLRPGGSLALSDIYLRNKDAQQANNRWPIHSCFSHATDLATVVNMVAESGFEVVVAEDHIQLLKQTAGEFVFAHGSLENFWKAVLGDVNKAECACLAAARTQPSLFLLIARREKE